jgi:hypothetical protein
VKRAAALFLAAVSAAPASALSITAMRAHNYNLAEAKIEELVADIDSNDSDRLDTVSFLYTDELGYVTFEEQEAFLKAMNSSDGRDDRNPMEVAAVKLLVRDKFYPVYLVTLKREIWKLTEFETDGCGNVTEHARPHWEDSSTTWLVTFQGNDIATFREADELFRVAR